MEAGRVSSEQIRIVFQGEEVTAVKHAFHEHNMLMEGLMGEDEVPDYHKRIARWRAPSAMYLCPDLSYLNEVFTYFDYTTEEVVDEILEDVDDPERIQKAAKRFRLQRLIQELQQDVHIADMPQSLTDELDR